MTSPSRRRIGGSILPSSDSRILTPIAAPCGRLQVRALPELDTHALFLDRPGFGEMMLASHPNGYSCHTLAERIVKGDPQRVREQVEYILACGGLAQSIERILAFMDERNV